MSATHGATPSEAATVKSASRLKTMSIWWMEIPKMVMVVAPVTPVKEGRPIDYDRRVEPPAKWAVKDSVRRDKCPGFNQGSQYQPVPYQPGPYQPGPVPM